MSSKEAKPGGLDLADPLTGDETFHLVQRGNSRYAPVAAIADAVPRGLPGLSNNAFATRAAMAAYAPGAGVNVKDNFFLSETGREGWFVVDLAANWAVQIAADPAQGLFVPSTSDATKVYRRIIGNAAFAHWFGVIGDGGIDDTAAIIAGATAVLAPGMPRILLFHTPAAFYRCDGQLNLESTVGLTFWGPGGRVEPVTDTAPCAIVYTGTAAPFVKMGKSHGLTVKGLAIQVSNAAFTGDIMTTDNDGVGGAVTYSTSIENCMVGGRTAAARNARSCINAQGAVELFIDQNTFGWADHHVISHAADGVLPFSNAVSVTRNRFNQQNIHAVNCFKGTQWLIDDNVFEQQFGGVGSSGVAAGISDMEIGGTTRGPCKVTITNNGFWDCDSGIWIDIYAFGQTVQDNYATLGGGATFVRYNGGSGGKISSNYATGTAGSKFMDFAVTPVDGLDDDGTNLVDGAVTYNANLTGFTPPDRAARDMAIRSSAATAIGGVGGFFHARKGAAGSGAFGGGFYFDRNDDVNWRGGGMFSYLDPTTGKECIAFTVAAAVTSPADTSQIRMLLTQDGDLIVPETAAAAVNSPAAGWQALFIDTADHKLKRKDSGGTVTVIA